MRYDNLFPYKTDGSCYNVKNELFNDQSLNAFLEEHYNKQQFNIPDDGNIEECKNMALTDNKDYFLISDLSKNVTNNLTYNCYIPKTNPKCDFKNLGNLIKPFNDILNDLLGKEGGERTKNLDISNIISSSSNLDNNIKCYKFTTDNGTNIFPRNTVFAIYKTELIDNPDIEQQLYNDRAGGGILPFDHYNNIYTDKFNENTFNGLLDNLTTNFRNYICTDRDNIGSSTTEKAVDNALTDLKNYFDIMINNLDDIVSDISKIELVTRFDTHKLQEIQKKIEAEQINLRNILGFDGANNGKLNDTNYLKNLKLSETIILSIAIISIIFMYSKLKN